MLTAKCNSGTTAPPIPSGLHEAVCYTVCDLGTEYSEMFKTSQRKIVLIWEIPGQRILIEDKDTHEKRDLPRVISKQYTLSLCEKANLRHDLESWRSKAFTSLEEKAFNLNNVLSAVCMLNIVHKSKSDGGITAVVQTIVPLKGKKIKPENPIVLYGIEEHGKAIPETLPQWIVEKIKASPEYQQVINPQPVDEPPSTNDDAANAEIPTDSDLPF
jgi:hypothetical protein